MTDSKLTTRVGAFPSLLDDEKAQQTVLHALRSGLGVAAASALIGISRQAMHAYRRKHPEFHDACIKATAEHEYGLVKVVNEGAADDAKLALELLSRRYPSKWSTRIEMRRDFDDDDREADDAGDLSDEELVALANGEKR